MLKVISFKICPFVQRVTALLEAKALDYEIEFISLANKPQWFLDISPNAQVPVLVTESGRALFESDAIVEYLDEAYPALLAGVDAEQRAIDRAYSYLGSKQYLVQCGTMRSSDQAAYLERNAKMHKPLSNIAAAKAEVKFFNGDQLSMVDIAWVPVLHRALIVKQHTGVDLLAPWPELQQWQATLDATGLFAASCAKDFEAAFTDFYLASATYLGQLKLVSSSGSCCARAPAQPTSRRPLVWRQSN